MSLHSPVMFNDVIAGLYVRAGKDYIDATAGRGGHSQGILERSEPDGRLLALDADPEAVAEVRVRLEPFGDRASVRQANFRSIRDAASDSGWMSADGILFDLGVSSPQLDTPERGFSFMSDGPLDMRMDPATITSAADMVNTLPEGELADLFYRFGEERGSRRLAKAIVLDRQSSQFSTTRQLAGLAERVLGRHGKVHPATRIFQALRIAVNGELDAIESALPQAVSLLTRGGRLAVIAFHSLEDRIVKRFIHGQTLTCICPPSQPICQCDHQPTLRFVSKGAIKAGVDEIKANSRSRSARLRVAERL